MAETTICWWEEEEYGGRGVQEERGVTVGCFERKRAGPALRCAALRCAALGGTEVGGKLR